MAVAAYRLGAGLALLGVGATVAAASLAEWARYSAASAIDFSGYWARLVHSFDSPDNQRWIVWAATICTIELLIARSFLAPRDETFRTQSASLERSALPLTFRSGRGRRVQHITPWLALLLLALTACERGYPESAKSTDTTAFLGAMFVGQAVAFVVEQGSVPRRVAIRLLWLALLLPWTTASILPGLIETDFAYRGARRWTGLWTNPNTFGALMGTGFVLSTGWLLVGSWHAPWRRFAKPTASSLEIIVWIPLAASVLSLGHGLVRSYSRGAWLGKVLGLGFLAWHLRKHSRRTEPRAQLWHRPNGLATVVTLIGVGVSVFWLARDTEWPLLRRVLSVANPNDFSWRNRVATLSDSLRIVADAPWTGVGWNRPLYHHAQWYQELELFENGAITLNDYLMLPMTLGLPALFAFAWSVRNSFRGRVGKELCCDLGGHEKSYETERITSMAAILTLMVVFWFDGGLFRLALAVPFWTRVACGQTGSSLYSNR